MSAAECCAQKEDWGALTLMDLLWSVLNHGNLPSPNCAALYHRDGSSCVSSKIKYYSPPATAPCCSITIMGRNIKGRNYQQRPLRHRPCHQPDSSSKLHVYRQSKVYISKFSKFSLQVQHMQHTIQ